MYEDRVKKGAALLDGERPDVVHLPPVLPLPRLTKERPVNRTIREEWEEFARRGLPHAGPAQRRDMECAFYGGALIALNFVAALGEASVTEAEGVDRIEALLAECRAFAAALRDERRAVSP